MKKKFEIHEERFFACRDKLMPMKKEDKRIYYWTNLAFGKLKMSSSTNKLWKLRIGDGPSLQEIDIAIT